MTEFNPKKLGEEADEMIRQQAQSDGTSETPEVETPELEAVAEVSETDDAIAQADSTTATDQGVESDEVPGDDVVVDHSAALAGMQKQLDTAEQRWKVLQGMIDKKDAELGTMRDLLASLNKQPAPQEVAAQPQAPAQVSEEDVKEYGQEYVDFVTRVARAQNSGADMSQFDARLKALEGSVQGVEQTTADTAQTIFFSELTQAMPEWRALNNDASFLQWLDQIDPFAGTSRKDLLQYAVSQGDAPRAATFFSAYTQETAPAPTGEVETPETPAAPSGKDKLVAPGRSRATPPKPDAKRNWTRAEITKLYDDKMAGRITAKEFDKLERDLFAAQSDGRIDVAA